jgi:GTP cyclohydrolase II
VVAEKGPARLLLTAERAAVLGLDRASDAVELTLPASAGTDLMLSLAGATGVTDPALLGGCEVATGDRRGRAALALARQARLLPALLVVAEPPSGEGLAPLHVTTDDVAAYPEARARSLQRLSRAPVPLAGAETCEFVVYREPFHDAEHVAIVIGTPDLSAPVPVRLHSACLTGDLLGSLRCDCGDQLRGAVERIAAAGGGVILYLAQEGRGIGLVNKLRAYSLQQQGLDTLQADRQLGFSADERDYAVACGMLRDLGIDRIVLLTNNPDKLAALAACEIEVVGRMPLSAPVNVHNAHYLRTKRELAGHLGDGS